MENVCLDSSPFLLTIPFPFFLLRLETLILHNNNNNNNNNNARVSGVRALKDVFEEPDELWVTGLPRQPVC